MTAPLATSQRRTKTRIMRAACSMNVQPHTTHTVYTSTHSATTNGVVVQHTRDVSQPRQQQSTETHKHHNQPAVITATAPASHRTPPVPILPSRCCCLAHQPHHHLPPHHPLPSPLHVPETLRPDEAQPQGPSHLMDQPYTGRAQRVHAAHSPCTPWWRPAGWRLCCSRSLPVLPPPPPPAALQPPCCRRASVPRHPPHLTLRVAGIVLRQRLLLHIPAACRMLP